ncbi:Methyltransferase FkbM domain-containing protein [Mesorhizobium sp. NFR06]|nr:Methyltransferase FkbM domain-containing protein [Mesorhizobium sp. NFR06]
MLNRKTLENDSEIVEALSSWGAKSIAGFAAFIIERMYRAEASNDVHSFVELRKHIEYFSKKAGVDLLSIIGGSDFRVDKAVFLDFSRNCLAVCGGIEKFICNREDIKSELDDIKGSLVRIQTQLLINSWVAETPREQLRERILTIGSLLSPMAVSGLDKIRIGSQTDGGYVMLDDFAGVDGALSLGINDDDSWDVDIARRDIIVHQYDNTIDKSPTSNDKFTFFKEEISSGNSRGVSIDDATDRIGGKKLVLKCDIEGSEWGAFASVDSNTLKKFSQIVCEFHGFGSINDERSYVMIEKALTKLHTVFDVIHVHANNSGPWMIISGVPFPSVIEITFANRFMYKIEESTEIFPTKLDYPNAPSLPEFYLGNFRYRRAP